MRLGIISDSHHYRDIRNNLYNLAILKTQFECWAELFDEVLICAPLIDGPPPVSHRNYTRKNIRLLPIPAAGGNNFHSKIDLVVKIPAWWHTLRSLLLQVDAVHIRCPNNISIPGLMVLKTTRKLRQAVYTGSWNGYPGEPLTYRWQRLFLRHFFDGPVAVYGAWQDQPKHIIPSFSPSFSHEDWERERERVEKKIKRLEGLSELPQPIRLLTVGALNVNKNQRLIIQGIKLLKDQGFATILNVLGSGDQSAELSNLAGQLGLNKQVRFLGQVSHDKVRSYFRLSDFVIQAPHAEGYGKVPIEGFLHGVIPILSNVDMSSQILGRNERGRLFPQGNPQELAQKVIELAKYPGEMVRLIRSGRIFAGSRTFEAWQSHLREMLSHYWNVSWPQHDYL